MDSASQSANRATREMTMRQFWPALLHPSTLVLLAANAMPLLGVLYWGWDVFVLLMLYWLETAVIGFWMIARIFRRARRDVHGRAHGVSVEHVFRRMGRENSWPIGFFRQAGHRNRSMDSAAGAFYRPGSWLFIPHAQAGLHLKFDFGIFSRASQTMPPVSSQ